MVECGYVGVVSANDVPDKLAPITFDPINNAYHKLGEKVGNAFQDGLKLK